MAEMQKKAAIRFEKNRMAGVLNGIILMSATNAGILAVRRPQMNCISSCHRTKALNYGCFPM